MALILCRRYDKKRTLFVIIGMNEGLIDKLRRRWNRRRRTLPGEWFRFGVRFGRAVAGAGAVMSVLVFVAALAAVAGLLIYGGFDCGSVSRSVLRKVLAGAQVTFIAAILFNWCLRFRHTWRHSHAVKRVADVLMLFTLIPLLWPYPDGSAGGIHFFRSRYFLYSVLALYSVAELSYGVMRALARRTNPSLILSASFLFFIFIGSFVLAMPRCTNYPVSYVDSLFMAASAVSMTGLCTVDVATAYTPLGWLVIAVLLQIGALGVLTFTSFFSIFFSGSPSIYNQLLIRDFIYSKSIGALVPVILYILAFTVTVEIIGAVALYFSLPDDFMASDAERVFFSCFHSVSGFCNGGFTTLPDGLASPALMAQSGAFYIVMTLLILAGGIGFPNLVNFKDIVSENVRRIRLKLAGRRLSGRRMHIYDLNTKLVLAATALLFVGGAVAFFILEYNGVLAGMPPDKKIVLSLFNAATPRTAGFGTFSITSFSHTFFLIMMFLMWVGCSSQSMGGGIKVNAFMAVVFNLRSVISGHKGVTAFGRNISLPSIRRANAVVSLSIFAVLLYSVVIMTLQPELPIGGVIFECFSAITTVGLSLGVTPELGGVSKMVLATAMFLGRVGIISVLCGFASGKPDTSPYLPDDNIIIN